nr:cation/H+ exchanger, cation/H+ exchanger, CPA1 family [Tanacetum cinerariifolium]
MEQKQSSNGDSQLPPLSAKYPWFVSQNLGADEDSSRDQYFYTLHDPLTKYQCQIPELLGRRIRGYYHGWVILSDHLQNVTWSLWNPVTSKMIPFPPLSLKDGDSESIREWGKRKKFRWIEMSYASQLKRISGEEGDFLHKLTCCNGFHRKTVEAAHLIRLNMTSVTLDDMERFKGLDMRFKRWKEQNLDDVEISMELWEQFFDLKDAIFFVDLVRDGMAYYRPGIDSELGGYIYIRDKVDNIYSYHVKEKTISLSYMPLLVLSTSNASLWDCRFEDDHGGAKCTLDSKQEKSEMVMIMGHCVSVEYLNFRATCKSYENQGIITFTDPMLGDKYFIKNLYISLDNEEIYCSSTTYILGLYGCWIFNRR